jgi:hypothetical protein
MDAAFLASNIHAKANANRSDNSAIESVRNGCGSISSMG